MKSGPTMPLPVRACAGALMLCAVASALYGATRFIQALLPESSPYPGVDSVTDAVFALFAAVGYAAATYGMLTHRWGARQLGLLVSGAFLPYGVIVAVLAYANLFGYPWDDPTETLLLVANCISLTAAMAGAVLGLASLWRRRVANYFAIRLPPISETRVRRMLLRSRLLLVTVTFTTTGVIIWLVTLAANSQISPGTDAASIFATMVGLLVIFLVLLVPGLLCAVSAALLRRYPGSRRVGLVGLWISALLSVPMMLVLAAFMTLDPATPDPNQLIWTLGAAIALLCELLGFGCVVSAVLLLNHPALRARLASPSRRPLVERPVPGPMPPA